MHTEGKEKAESWLRKRRLQSTCKQNYCYEWQNDDKKSESAEKKQKHEKSAVDGSVRRSPIQVLTGFALLNFTEKRRALCFHPTWTVMQNGWK